jgi:uncharacterized membrane protein
MRFEDSVDVAAPAQQVFDTYADVEHWPSWTSTVTSVELLDKGPLRVGFRARLRQPRLPVAVWQVTALVPGREFTWVSRGRGVETVGVHRVAALTDATSRVTAIIEQTGPLAVVGGLLGGRLIRRYLRTEVEGIKAYCEG